MKQEVIAVFDIGKTNKKILLFDESVNVVYQEEQKFDEILDDDGFACDDIDKIESWIWDALKQIENDGKFEIKAVNFAPYGATLIYLDEQGKRLTPAYNYLKPMPEDVIAGFYEKYGGIEEFSRSTASPALGYLNSGLQILWLKKKKPEIYRKTKTILHFPQYLSYLLSGKISSEYTSIGCHTALWNFDNMKYHKWVGDENIQLPEPVSNSITIDAEVNAKKMKVGTGIHDSSASLVPYLKGSAGQFILVSTGTWHIFMNPFNPEALTAEQLKKDSLCYMSVNQQQVKSSRLFMGHIHDINAGRLAKYFKLPEDQFKRVKADEKLLQKLNSQNKGKMIFFINGIPSNYLDETIDPGRFGSFEEAYHQLMLDITTICKESLNLIIPSNDQSKQIFISGGFSRNELYVKLLATHLPYKKVYTSEMDNATALGAALMVWDSAFSKPIPDLNLGLKEYKGFKL